jgi:hypothetical protein
MYKLRFFPGDRFVYDLGKVPFGFIEKEIAGSKEARCKEGNQENSGKTA